MECLDQRSLRAFGPDRTIANVGDVVVAAYLYNNKTYQFGIVDKYMPKSNRWRIILVSMTTSDDLWHGMWHSWCITPLCSVIVGRVLVNNQGYHKDYGFFKKWNGESIRIDDDGGD